MENETKKNRIWLLLYLSVISFSLQAWEFVEEKDGIKLFTQKSQFTGVEAFRGITTIDATLQQLFALIDDIDVYPQWQYECVSAKTLEKISDSEQIIRIVTNLPWPVSDRESIIHLKARQNADTGELWVYINSESDYIYEHNASDLVRTPAVKGYWKLTRETNGMVTVEFQIDAAPGGMIPDWIVRMFVLDAPYYTLHDMKRQVADTKYQNKKYAFIQ